MIELSGYAPINLVCVVALGALLLRRLVRMDGLHRTRVVILTALLWAPAVYLFILAYAQEPDYYPQCTPADHERGAFCIME